MKVLVIGETCVDEFIYCKINRLSPEAPVPILNPTRTERNAGMAGNTTSNVKALSPQSEVSFITSPNRITKTRYVEKKTNHMFLRVDKGEDNINKFSWDSFKKLTITEADVVIVSDYNKGYLSDDDLDKIARYSTLSILDSKRKLTQDLVKQFTFVKLNEDEYQSSSNLIQNSKNVIVTLGSKGSMYGGKVYPSPNPQETIDVSGAGDTFTAAFAISYFKSPSVSKAIKFANQKSSEVVSQRGVVTPK
tara:strand:- start:174 stop:917 length:744 start_codon:yes stop_codon:yes gene_type:complete